MREELLKLLENEYSALDIITINDKLKLNSAEELRELQYELNNLVREQLLHESAKHKFILLEHCPDFRKGKLQVNQNSGNAFVCLEDEEDIFIPREKVGFALNGDIVLAKIDEVTKKGPEGVIIKILERDINNIVGEIKSDGKKLYFEPKEKKNIQLLVDEDSLKSCVEGEIVCVSIVEDLGKNKYAAVVAKHICHKDDAMQDILTIAANYEIFADFPEDAIKQAEEMPDEISGELLEEELKIRKDLRDKMIFTIDGADTKDVDDAISLEYKDGYYYLGVHIADVSHYVTEGSPLDVEALNRGTSSYLAYSVIPMLPHKLSNGICSLNPEVVRCALSCEMKLDNRGRVVDYDIFPSLIKSNKKMTYSAVNEILENDTIPEGYEPFADTLKLMNELAHIIRTDRIRRGACDFDIDEAKIICDENGKPIDIKARERGEGERLIEDFMVIANETVGGALYSMELPSIYRVHDLPSPEKLSTFINFCSANGIKINGKIDFENITPKVYQSIVEQLPKEGPVADCYKALGIRTMAKAKYDKNNIGHFGLAVLSGAHGKKDYNHFAYSHFTSPIRRYPDLLLHRLVWTYLVFNKIDEKTIDYWNLKIDDIAKRSSDREIKAVEAEREVDKLKMAEYMEDHIGEEYDAVISGVSKKGFFVKLPNLVEGLVLIDSLDGHFEYIEELMCLRDPSSKKTYKFGDELRVKCVGASKESMKIDFEEVRVKRNDFEPEEKEEGKSFSR